MVDRGDERPIARGSDNAVEGAGIILTTVVVVAGTEFFRGGEIEPNGKSETGGLRGNGNFVCGGEVGSITSGSVNFTRVFCGLDRGLMSIESGEIGDIEGLVPAVFALGRDVILGEMLSR